ncbi:hypothetical protein QUC31_017121 [Theobroma cacao]
MDALVCEQDRLELSEGNILLALPFLHVCNGIYNAFEICMAKRKIEQRRTYGVVKCKYCWNCDAEETSIQAKPELHRKGGLIMLHYLLWQKESTYEFHLKFADRIVLFDNVQHLGTYKTSDIPTKTILVPHSLSKAIQTIDNNSLYHQEASVASLNIK